MRFHILLASFFASLALVVSQAHAQSDNDVYLGQPAYGGTGCPAGSAAAVLSPDAKTLSILFDQYVANAGGEMYTSVDRKSCNIAVPVHVPSGYSVSLFKVDYRGFNYLPRNAFSRFNAEYFFAGQRGPRWYSSYRGPEAAPFTATDEVTGAAMSWSRCGEDVILRANTGIFLYNPSRSEQAITSVDSADIGASLIYHLQWRRCY